MASPTTLETRIRIMDLSKQGLSDRAIAERLHLSVSTVRKWRRRADRSGRDGLYSQMGRPVRGALSAFPTELEEFLVPLCERYPSWGAKTLLAELKRHAYWKQENLPSIATLQRWRKQRQLTRSYQFHHPLPDTGSEEKPAFVHDEWEMDAKGYQYIPDLGVIALIILNDCYSHTRLFAHPCILGNKRRTRHASTADYQAALRLAFVEWGLPKRLSVDHESVFYDNDHNAPFPTQLHRWLISLGVELQFGRKGFATDQAVTERSHQLWHQQVIEGQQYHHLDQLRARIQDRRDFLNFELPNASLGEKPPLEAFPQAQIPKRIYHLSWEKDMLDLNRLYTYLAKGRWFRKVSKDGTLSLGAQIYYLSRQYAREQVEITFDVESASFLFYSTDNTLIVKRPIKGNAKSDLMGEMAPWIGAGPIQLPIPFTYEQWRMTQVTQSVKGTTL